MILTEAGTTCQRRNFTIFPTHSARIQSGYSVLTMFCARGYNLSESTRNYIRGIDFTADFAELPVERVFLEMEKAMSAKYPHRFFEEMVRGVGQGREFFPDVFKMPDIPAGPPEYHPEIDLFSHSLDVLQKVAAMTTDPVTRTAAFFHDLGKILTPVEEWPRHLGHDERGEGLAREVLHRLCAPGEYIRATALVNQLHMKSARFAEMRASSKIRFAQDATPVAHILPLVVKADSDIELENFDEVVGIANLSATKLGISVDKLKTMDPINIQSLINQKRCEHLNYKRAKSPERQL